MPPPIKELRKQLQKSRKYETVWYARVFARPVSIYITWLLIHTPITANQATLIQILLTWLGSALLIIFQQAAIIPTIILYQLSYVFDCVDGEIARYKKQSSLFGVVLDSVGHVLITPAMFWGIAIYIYLQTNNIWHIYAMILLSIFLISPVKHALMRGVFFLTTYKDNPVYNIENLKRKFSQEEPSEKNKSLTDKISRFIKDVTEYPNDMNIFSILLLLNLIFNNPIFSIIGLYFYLVLIIIKEFYFLYSIKKKHLVEKEYLKIYDTK